MTVSLPCLSALQQRAQRCRKSCRRPRRPGSDAAPPGQTYGISAARHRHDYGSRGGEASVDEARGVLSIDMARLRHGGLRGSDVRLPCMALRLFLDVWEFCQTLVARTV